MRYGEICAKQGGNGRACAVCGNRSAGSGTRRRACRSHAVLHGSDPEDLGQQYIICAGLCRASYGTVRHGIFHRADRDGNALLRRSGTAAADAARFHGTRTAGRQTKQLLCLRVCPQAERVPCRCLHDQRRFHARGSDMPDTDPGRSDPGSRTRRRAYPNACRSDAARHAGNGRKLFAE